MPNQQTGNGAAQSGIDYFSFYLTTMATRKKQPIRVVFDVLDEMNRYIQLNGDVCVAAADPDEAIDWVYAEMQRQFNRSDIRLAKVRICA